MKYFGYMFVAIVAGTLFASSTNAALFFRNLTIGSEGNDVKNLQILLNQNAQTIVSTTGAGSPGFETSYFGPRTADAVRRFQNLYASDVLTPVGLSTGTGYFGPSTREKMHALQASGAVSSATTSTTSTLQTSSQVPHITSISPSKIKTGDYITLTGSGFDGKNLVILDNFPRVNSYSDFRMRKNGTELTFKVESVTPYALQAEADKLPESARKVFLDGVTETAEVYFEVSTDAGESNGARYTLITNEL